ncbi:patatin-like phospholipase family protein [Saccharopolyspora sp. K220]|uniref:patatin-like phospholipase family protein n=1 Tax=Saccharopolyspora soli TaxID=2926618 RepID=UPI001F58E4EA|nr:patatin-like phospholipase family protein [Saccharopolyspora soli]MCI2418157.1 patatin-like phospholipase family protein [Saccharopolyspora soli]
MTGWPRPVAFVLGAGGSHGAVQVGQLRALAEHGVHPDFIVGCSVGALNAAVRAAEPASAVAHLDALWRRAGARDLFCLDGGSMRDRGAVFSNAGLGRLAESVLSPRCTFEQLAVPLFVLATDGGTRRQHVLSGGPLLPALLASCAIPFLLPAVEIDGVRLIDGGIRHDLPIAEAFELGAATVIALPTTRWPRPVGYRSSAPVDDRRVLVLGGAASPGTGWTFSRTSRLIERGYRTTSWQLRDLAQRGRRVDVVVARCDR